MGESQLFGGGWFYIHCPVVATMYSLLYLADVYLWSMAWTTKPLHPSLCLGRIESSRPSSVMPNHLSRARGSSVEIPL
jgi:hypothetical protein